MKHELLPLAFWSIHTVRRNEQSTLDCGRERGANSREEALINIKEAIEGYVAALKDDDIPIPEEHFQVLVAVV